MEFADYARFLFALLLVLGLIGLLAVAAKRFGLTPKIIRNPNKKDQRLAVVDMTAIDGKRRLVLVRRDDVEHLILLSPTAETVVEAGIRPTPAASVEEDDEPFARPSGSPSRALEPRPTPMSPRPLPPRGRRPS